MMPMNGMDTLLTVRQLQDLLQVDRITIYRMLGDGRLQGFKVGGQWRFPRQAIESWLRQQQAGVEALGPVGVAVTRDQLHPSPDALPLSCIEAIQDIFAQALGIAAVTTAVEGTPITPIANSCRFCNLILDTETGRQRCISSWRAAAAEAGSGLGPAAGGTPRIIPCHAGLCYIWGRVEVEGQLVAAVHAGQFLDCLPDKAGRPVDLAGLAAATRLEAQELRDALALVPVLDRDRQRQVTRLVQRMAATFSEISAERLSLLGRLQRIAEITGY
jgi:excisionase family DNA binding protein